MHVKVKLSLLLSFTFTILLFQSCNNPVEVTDISGGSNAEVIYPCLSSELGCINSIEAGSGLFQFYSSYHIDSLSNVHTQASKNGENIILNAENIVLNDALIGFLLCLIGIYLALAWVFASWARPIVVMSIIPFGLIGTLWGHYLWGINLSMFSIIGLIGMTGIIINDSIVLVSTIDEYSKTRGLKPAIVDAICDRLRPVLLTTLTTVLGLMPLLFETSKDAQFLKPTIVTLVYGLGFGMLIVLFLVPSIVLIQKDFADLVKSFKSCLLYTSDAADE